MADLPGAGCIPFGDLPLDPTGRRRVVDGDGPATVFFCGAYDFEGDLCRPTLDALPPTFRLRPGPGSTLRATMDLGKLERVYGVTPRPWQDALADVVAELKAAPQ